MRRPNRKKKMGDGREMGQNPIVVTLKVFMLFAALALTSCDDAEPIKIGYVGGLTGRNADLGREGRDGALLVIELVNENGGINGQPIELIVKDDRQNAEVARTVDQELLDAGVIAVVGHMTSSMSMIGADIFSQAEVPLISPTTSTNNLFAQDDYFFRIYPPSKGAAKQLAEWISQTSAMKNVVALYDVNNRAHTESWLNAFDISFHAYGGNVVKAFPFKSDKLDGVSAAIAAVVSTEASGVFILANGLDAALLIQNLKKSGDERPIFITEWSATEDFLRYGGAAVENVKFLSTINMSSKSDQYQSFKSLFNKRFHRDPSFAAVHTADTVRFLLSVLEKDPDPKRLKRNLLSAGQFEGLQQSFSLGEFGDVDRDLFPMRVKDGQFVSAHEKGDG